MVKRIPSFKSIGFNAVAGFLFGLPLGSFTGFTDQLVILFVIKLIGIKSILGGAVVGAVIIGALGALIGTFLFPGIGTGLLGGIGVLVGAGRGALAFWIDKNLG